VIVSEGRGTEGFDREEEVELGNEYAERIQVLDFARSRPGMPRRTFLGAGGKPHHPPSGFLIFPTR
jgi:hypothetical protein